MKQETLGVSERTKNQPEPAGHRLQATILSSAGAVFMVLCAVFYLAQHFWLSEIRAQDSARVELQHMTRMLTTSLRTCGLPSPDCAVMVRAVIDEHPGASIVVNDTDGKPLITVAWQTARSDGAIVEH